MTMTRAFVLVLAFACALPAAASRDVRVTLRESAVVAEPDVRMGAIASIEGDAAIAGPLARFEVAAAPRPGYSERLAMATLQRYVRVRFPDWSERIEWTGAPAVEVEVAAVPLDLERLEQAALEHLRATWGAAYDLQLAVNEPVGPALVPSGAISIKPRAMAADAVPASRTLVWLDVFVNGAFQRSVVVPVRVAAVTQVLVARADLAPDRDIQREDFEARRMDVSSLASAVARELPAPGNRRLRRTLRAGDPLLATDLVARPAVARGESVNLLAGSSLVRIEARVTALADAALGQALWVRMGAHGETLRARVIAPGTVEVANP